MKKYEKYKIVSMALFIMPIVLFAGIHYGKNQNGMYTDFVCTESNGARVDPNTGDGPECLEGEEKSWEESPLRSATRGIPTGFIIGLVLYFIWESYIGSKQQKRREENRKSREAEFKGELRHIKTKEEAMTLLRERGLSDSSNMYYEIEEKFGKL